MSDTLEQQAETIIEQVLALPEPDRQPAAIRACGDDPELLRRVLSLLSADPLVGGFMDATVDSPSAAFAAVGEKPGDVIGRYKLLEKIGEGGFGVVFTAEQQKPVRRLVALKVIKLGMDTREVVARFEAERQALALMDHPSIAKVLDAGATDAGRPYFVMELVRGSPITDYSDKHQLNMRDRVALAIQVCRAVQHAHSKGIIHRDLKPSNVLVTVFDDKPVPKVIDFGIAKATQSRLTDRTLFTAFRQLIGTPQYMSPEQADSDGSDIDTRTDVYSLGVLLYELLVGTTPIDATQLRSAAYEAMRKMIRDTDLPRPATRLHTLGDKAQATIASARSTDVKKLEQSVKGELDWIVMKALEKDRSRRYDTAAAMSDDLGRYINGEAVLAGPPGGMYRLKKIARRYRGIIVSAAVIGLVLLIGVAGTSIGLIQATRLRWIAEQRRQEADDARAKAEVQRKSALAVVKFLTDDILAKASPGQVPEKAVRDTLVRALIAPAAVVVAERFPDQPLVRASVQQVLAVTLRQLGRPELALTQAQAALASRETGLKSGDPDLLASTREVALDLMLLGQPARSEEMFARLRTMQTDDQRQTVQSIQDYASILNAQGQYDKAEPLYRKVWQDDQKQLGNDDPQTIAAEIQHGKILTSLGQFDSAEEALAAAWDHANRVLGEDHVDTIRAMAFYADVLGDLKQNEKALPLAQKAWEKERNILGDDHQYTVEQLYEYTMLLYALRRDAEVQKAVDDSVDSVRRTGRADTPFAQILYMQSSFRRRQGDLEGSLSPLKEAIQLLQAVAPDDPFLGRDLYWMGKTLMVLKHYDVAEDYLRQNYRYDLSHPNADGSISPMSLKNLNKCLTELHKPLEGESATQPSVAAATSRPAVAGSRKPQSPTQSYPHTGPGSVAYGQAKSLVDNHRSRDAVPLYQQAADLDRAAGPDARFNLAKDLIGLADTLPVAARSADAVVAAQEAVTILRADRPAHDSDLVEADRELGQLYVKAARLDDAIACYIEAVSIDDSLKLDVYFRTEDRMSLAHSQEKKKDYPAAEQTLRTALKLRQTERSWGHTGKLTQTTARALASVLDKQQEHAQADQIRIEAGLSPLNQPADTQPTNTPPT